MGQLVGFLIISFFFFQDLFVDAFCYRPNRTVQICFRKRRKLDASSSSSSFVSSASGVTSLTTSTTTTTTTKTTTTTSTTATIRTTTATKEFPCQQPHHPLEETTAAKNSPWPPHQQPQNPVGETTAKEFTVRHFQNSMVETIATKETL